MAQFLEQENLSACGCCATRRACLRADNGHPPCAGRRSRQAGLNHQPQSPSRQLRGFPADSIGTVPAPPFHTLVTQLTVRILRLPHLWRHNHADFARTLPLLREMYFVRKFLLSLRLSWLISFPTLSYSRYSNNNNARAYFLYSPDGLLRFPLTSFRGQPMTIFRASRSLRLYVSSYSAVFQCSCNGLYHS